MYIYIYTYIYIYLIIIPTDSTCTWRRFDVEFRADNFSKPCLLMQMTVDFFISVVFNGWQDKEGSKQREY